MIKLTWIPSTSVNATNQLTTENGARPGPAGAATVIVMMLVMMVRRSRLLLEGLLHDGKAAHHGVVGGSESVGDVGGGGFLCVID